MTKKTARTVEEVRTPSLQIDWKEYFYSFMETHGGNPVEFEGRLLFNDGWTYSKSDYRGPEFAPPKDKKRLKFMRLAYWKIRLKIVSKEHVALKDLMEAAERLMINHSAPLKHRVTIRNEDESNGKVTLKEQVIELDPAIYADRLNWLAQDIADCNTTIAAIEKEPI